MIVSQLWKGNFSQRKIVLLPKSKTRKFVPPRSRARNFPISRPEMSHCFWSFFTFPQKICSRRCSTWLMTSGHVTWLPVDRCMSWLVTWVQMTPVSRWVTWVTPVGRWVTWVGKHFTLELSCVSLLKPWLGLGWNYDEKKHKETLVRAARSRISITWMWSLLTTRSLAN